MAENPFDSFFTGLIGGATAGARRRTLMERGQQGAGMAEEFFGGGPVTPPKAPGMGATFLAGLQLARTLPTTPSQQLQADQLKLQIANQALDQQIFEAKQQAAEAEKITLKTKAKAEAEAERDNSVLFADLLSRAETDISVGKFDTISGIKKEASSLPVAQQVQLNSAIGDLSRTYDLQKAREFNANKEILSQYLPPEEIEKLSPIQVQTLVETASGRSQSGIGQMVGDYNNYMRLGMPNLAQLVLPAIEKQAAATGKRMEVGPDGRVIIAEGVGVDPAKPLTTAVTGRMQEQAITASTLLGRIEALDEQVTPETVGAGGVVRNLRNIIGGTIAGLRGEEFTEFREDVASTKQDLDALQSDLADYIRADSGNMSDRDLQLLLRAVPQFSLAEPYQSVKTKTARLRNLFLLKEFIARKELGTLGNLLREQGAERFADSISAGSAVGFEKPRILDLVRKSVGAIPRGEPAFPTIKVLQDKGVLSEEEALQLMKDLGMISVDTEPGSVG